VLSAAFSGAWAARRGHPHLEGAARLGLVGLEHHVRLEQLADVCLQLERGQLQEPDRLLQLRVMVSC